MQRRTFTISLAASMAATLTACSKHELGISAVAPTQILDTIARKGRGFTAGSIDSSTVAYVIFDPSCGHCAALWQASSQLENVKFFWVPVAIMIPRGKSTRQGAALLSAHNSARLMDTHEASILAGTGGLSVDSVSAEAEAAIDANTKLFGDLGLESVPLVVARNVKTGVVATKAGAMTTQALATWLGVGGS